MVKCRYALELHAFLCYSSWMNPVRDAEKHNPLMAQSKKNFCRLGRLWAHYGSAEQNTRVVGYYFFNRVASPVAVVVTGASYL